jgi:hypothetical protein
MISFSRGSSSSCNDSNMIYITTLSITLAYRRASHVARRGKQNCVHISDRKSPGKTCLWRSGYRQEDNNLMKWVMKILIEFS